MYPYQNKTHLFFNPGLIIVLVFTLFSCKTIEQKPENHKPPETDDGFYYKHSQLLKVTLKGNEDKKLIECLSSWMGTPYKYGGNTHLGTDCSGMVMMVYKETYNISLYRSSADQIKNVKTIDKQDLKCGDLVFFKISGNKISHVGIYIASNKFIHATTKRGVVTDDLDTEYYKKYYYASGRVISKTGPQ
jgi:lipoprotein Spr/probable lipoprotein NlpC